MEGSCMTIIKRKALHNVVRRDLELDALVEILNKKRFVTCHSYYKVKLQLPFVLLKDLDLLKYIHAYTGRL